MPILHTRPDTSAVDAQGNPTQVTPQIALQIKGPRLQVTVGLHPTLAGPLVQQGGQLPSPVAGWALIDTGATLTTIDDGTAQALGLPVIDVVNIGSASHPSTQQNVYPALLTVAGTPLTIAVDRAVGGPILSMGIIALIGRDVSL